jgi:hypothetical protein
MHVPKDAIAPASGGSLWARIEAFSLISAVVGYCASVVELRYEHVDVDFSS